MLCQKISFLEPQGFQRINKNKFCKMKCVILYLWNKTKTKQHEHFIKHKKNQHIAKPNNRQDLS